ncbi:MAG: alpha/beta hydrolase [Sphingomicrobium sp.]
MKPASAILALLAAAAATAGAQQRLPQECRAEIVALCPMGGGLRDCVRAALPKLSENCRKAISDRAGANAVRPEGMTELAYGSDPKQRIDFVRPVLNRTVPLIVHIHGGGWSIGDKTHAIGAKAAHFNGLGWAFASVNYRLVPAATVEQQAGDVASAVAYLRAHAIERGLDPDRIVLMGHSAGAHLAALVASDPAYFKAAGVPMAAVRGVVLLDGAGYNVTQQMARPGNMVSGMYDAAFGRDPRRQAALSPTRHAAAPNVADWLIMPVATRRDSTAQSSALAAALTRAGTRATVVPVPDTNHAALNRQLGVAGDFATGRVDAFLAGLR